MATMTTVNDPYASGAPSPKTATGFVEHQDAEIENPKPAYPPRRSILSWKKNKESSGSVDVESKTVKRRGLMLSPLYNGFGCALAICTCSRGDHCGERTR